MPIKIAATLLCALLAFGCSRPAPQPHPEALAPFSTALRQAQPSDAFAAVYRLDDARLVWLGAKHATRTDSQTFRYIREAYDAFTFDLVIVEGCPTSWGPNPERLLSFARRHAANAQDGFVQGGEAVPAVLGAVDQGADIICGEPDDTDIKARVQAAGFALEDLLGFYVLRSIPQWIRERRIDNAADPRIDALLAEELDLSRQRLRLEPAILASADHWRAWYRALNGKALSADFSTEEAGPLIDGLFGSNAVAAAISRARAQYLHELVIGELGAQQDVFVVFGASHLMIHKPALDAAMGAACLVGVAAEGPTFQDCA